MTGPYVRFAVFCQNARPDERGLLTLEHILDEIRLGNRTDKELACFVATSVAFGDIVGSHQILCRVIAPSGEVILRHGGSVEFSLMRPSMTTWHALKLPLTAGTYWLEVVLDEETLLTRSPLRMLPRAQDRG